MTSDASELLREIVSLLRQITEEQRRQNAIRDELAKSLGEKRPDFTQQRKDHEHRLEEIRREGEQRRREEQDFREQLLAELRKQTGILAKLLAGSERGS